MSEQHNVEIGEQLKAARLAKGFTLDDIQQTTKIQKRYLNAIESGDFKQLPGDFYVRAFIRQFAQAVDLDADKLLVDAPKEVIEPTTDLSTSRTDLDNVTRTGMDNEQTPVDKIQSLVPKIIIGLLVVVVLVVIWVIAMSLSTKTDSQHKVDTSSVSVQSSKVSKEDKVSEKSSSKKKDEDNKDNDKEEKKLEITDGEISGSTTNFSVKNVKKDKDYSLEIDSKNRTWVSVTTADGKSLVNELLQANGTKQVTIPANTTQVTVRSGFATGTSIKFDDKDLNIPSSNDLTRNYKITFDQENKEKGDD